MELMASNLHPIFTEKHIQKQISRVCPPDFFARDGAEEPFASSGGIKDAVATLTGSIPMDER